MNAQNETKIASTWSEIDDLQYKTVAQLQIRYREVFGESSRSNHKQFLIRRVAWRLQALAEGDLSERARQRAAELANDADLRMLPPPVKPAPVPPQAEPARPRGRDPLPVAERGDGLQENTRVGLEVDVPYDGAGLVEDAEVQCPGMPVDAGVKSVVLVVERILVSLGWVGPEPAS